MKLIYDGFKITYEEDDSWTCRTCKKTDEEVKFGKRVDSSSGLQYHCKICKAAKRKESYDPIKEKQYRESGAGKLAAEKYRKSEKGKEALKRRKKPSKEVLRSRAKQPHQKAWRREWNRAKPYVYVITNLDSKRKYYGESSIRENNRWIAHKNKKPQGQQGNEKFQQLYWDFKKLGVDKFKFEALEFFESKQEAVCKEMELIASDKNCYNIQGRVKKHRGF